MKNSAIIFILILLISCSLQHENNENLVRSNSYLIGKWTGEGKFLDVNFDKEFGKVMIEIEIREDNTIIGKIGEAQINSTSIVEAKYGFEIRGILNSKLKNDKDFNKNRLVILLVLPDENREDVTRSDANFHLKSNFIFDINMRVGGVILTKEL